MFAHRAAGLVGLAAVVAGCSSGSGSPAQPPPTTTTAPTASESSDGTATQDYLDAVNRLCDDLLPTVVAATHGGSIDIPARQYLRDWPAHRRLLHAFDADLAGIPVPASARHVQEAMTRYVAYADRLDAARLAAAQQGEAPFRAEVRAEEEAPPDPSVAARTRAGFAQSCDAR